MNDVLKRGVQTWIQQMLAAFFERGIMDLVPRWQSTLLVKETMLTIKINKLVDFTESALAAILSHATISRFALTLLLTSL